jgi:hypothetical protein
VEDRKIGKMPYLLQTAIVVTVLNALDDTPGTLLGLPVIFRLRVILCWHQFCLALAFRIKIKLPAVVHFDLNLSLGLDGGGSTSPNFCLVMNPALALGLHHHRRERWQLRWRHSFAR